jgi:uncharacterized protein GlcG (DUF336 family)
MKKLALAATLAGMTMAAPISGQAQDGALVGFNVMKPEIATKLAQAAMDACRKDGAQVAVAVVDRFGVLQALVRDRFAGPHTPDTSRRKAWTAVSFRSDTLTLSQATRPGSEAYGANFITDALILGGGVPVEANGSIVGAVGVSGAPAGSADDKCARAGIEAIAGDLAF